MTAPAASNWFRRLVLPGLAFKAVVIGGGYATGRELAEFFLPAGPVGGLLGLLITMLVWSATCVLTFLFAYETHSREYRSFFRHLLGRFWVTYEIAYVAFIILILSVFGAAAGLIGQALFGLPEIVGTLGLVVGIAAFATFGNEAVERLFKYVSILLYVVYAVFAVLAFTRFGSLIATSFATYPRAGDGFALGGLTYAAYNVIGAVIILPTLRHLTSRKDAVVAGVLCGPLAAIPAVLFFVCMAAFYPQIGAEPLPANFLLSRLQMPAFQVLFQLMIFSALLESGTGSVHALNERIAATFERHGRTIGRVGRLASSLGVLVLAVFVASGVGLVALIAQGYRALAFSVLAVFVVPLFTLGLWRLGKAGAFRLFQETPR